MSQSGALPTPDGAKASGANDATGKLIGSTISGRYKVLSVLGEGGMGAVYLAEHALMRKKVALKVLHPEMLKRPEVVQRFEREAMAAAHIDHPHVATATDFGRTDDGSFFLVLEYIEGTSLRDTLVRVGGAGLGVTRALNVARQIADALVRAHEIGIVHRDLKPENVMLLSRGNDYVKVLDFGIAKVPIEQLGSSPPAPGQVLTRAGAVFGTPEYMAPEQALGESVTASADLYTLGVMLYEMLTGKLPFERSDDTVSLLARQIAETPPPPTVRAPAAAIPPAVDAIVMRLLHKNPAERFASAAELVAALDANGASASAGPPSSPNVAVAAPSSASGGAPSAPGVTSGNWSSADAHAKTSLPSAEPPPTVSRPKTIGLGGEAQAEGDAPAGAGLSPLARTFASRLGIDVNAITAGLPPQVRRLLPAAIVAAIGGTFLLGALLLVTVAVRAVRGTHATTDADGGAVSVVEEHASPKLSDETIAAAAQSGPAALEALSQKYPDDARVLRELVKSYSMQGSHAEAMRVTTRLLALEPRAGTEDFVVDAVTAAAQATNPDAVDQAISLCERSLGTRGPDVLYDLSLRPSSNKARFADALMSPDARSHASPALGVLLDLRAARTCDERKALLPRATSDGDARTLVQLQKMARGRRCGFFARGDCCIAKEDLDDSIDALSARVGSAATTTTTGSR